MKVKITYFLFFSLPLLSSGQDESFQGARTAGLANSSITLADAFTPFNNVGALGFLEYSTLAVGYTNHYEMAGLDKIFFAGTKNTTIGVFTISASKFGDDLFNITSLKGGFGNKFGIASLGASLNYNHYWIEGFGSRGFFSVDIGGLVELSPQIFIGGLLLNVTQAKISKLSSEYYPTIFITGISYRPTENLMLNAQVEKDLRYPAFLKFGIEYIIKSLVLRTGLNTDPAWFAFGVGFIHTKFLIDYAIQNNYQLGRTHNVSLAYRI